MEAYNNIKLLSVKLLALIPGSSQLTASNIKLLKGAYRGG
jgi:hypothetical protein